MKWHAFFLAAALTSSGVLATSQRGTGRPWASKSVFASASWIFTPATPDLWQSAGAERDPRCE